MTTHARRELLKSAAALSATLLSACGGGGSSATQEAGPPGPAPAQPPAPAPPAPAPAPAPAPIPLPPAPTGKYRTTQTFLFQTVPSRYIPSRLPDGSDFYWDAFGPTHAYVDFHTGWEWSKPGGDWLDQNKVRHGTKPWFSIPVDKVSGSTASASYTGDVTAALQFIQSGGRWCAFLLDAKNAARVIAGVFNTQFAPPSIDVSYANGQTAKLACRVMAGINSQSVSPATTSATYTLPVLVEFERPTAAVASAKLNFVITEHWSGAAPTLEGFVLDPPITADTGQAGIAASAGKLDAGIENNPNVIGVHRYLDGRTLSEFTHNGDRNYAAERNYDPAIFGTGPTDLSKYPHAGLGKWINTEPSWSLVNSGYRGEGFEALAPGLGALRIHMPREAVQDGSVVGYGGTGVSNAMIFLPEPLFGVLGRIFVRYYFRLGTPYAPTAVNRYQVYNSPGSADWTTHAGKFGIVPDHTTSYGGVSGSSGGGNGWQMRLLWADCDAGTAGPNEGGWAAGYHLYDFNYQNPPGHNYGSQQSSAEERWGQKGGAGGVLYAGRWYCVETELKLNTVSLTGAGFQPDGELRAWIDGRLVYVRTGMVFRTLPLVSAPQNADKLRPCRELGVRGLWLNWFHGGKTAATIDRTTFYTGLVWAKDYIGPMQT